MVFEMSVVTNIGQPALVPLLMISQKYFQPGLLHSPGQHASFYAQLTGTVVGTTLIAIFSVVALSGWDRLAYALSIIPVVALFIAYSLLTPKTGKHSLWLRGVDFEAAVRPLSLRIAVILAFELGRETLVVGFPNTNVIESVTSGLAKALAWYFTAQVVCNTLPLPRYHSTYSPC
jgi:hypothetical protein